MTESPWEGAMATPVLEPEMAWEQTGEPPVFTMDAPPEQLSSDVHSLMQVGYLEKDIEVYGHTAHIRTLKVGEELYAGILAQEFDASTEGDRAWVTAIVSSAIESVDSRPLVRVIGPGDPREQQKKRQQLQFRYLLANYHWIVIEEFWREYKELLERVKTAAAELKALSTAEIPSPSS